MDSPTAYEFVMDRFTPDTIPMKRLAQYLDKLSDLLGCKEEHIHFKKITKGSARPALIVDEVVAAEVARNLHAANDHSWAQGARTRKEINRMLLEDGQVAYLRVTHGPKVMEFSGRKTPIVEEVTVHEAGELEGIVIRVGGRDDTVPVHLQSMKGDEIYKCWTSRSIAKQLAPLLFDNQIRVSGKGKWRRNPEGFWRMEDFKITEFEVLGDTPLADFLQLMRAIPGSGWNEMADPQAELKRIRGE